MPELPEVETIRRGLQRELVGRRITALAVRETRLRSALDADRLREGVLAREVLAITRRAKYLLIELGRPRACSSAKSVAVAETSVLIHLGMSGQLSLHAGDEPRASHTHVEWTLDDGRALRFRDPRRFGLVDAVPVGEILQHPRLRGLGVEPLSSAFRAEALHARTRGRRRAVKSFLMDAGEVVGIGNIYASEALHGAGVHPERAIGRIASVRWERIVTSVRAVLEAAIEQGGTTLNDYRDAAGNRGSFGARLAVYGREGAPCHRCGEAIRRRVDGGRSTYYCARCQR